jgi:hypothetical protein
MIERAAGAAGLELKAHPHMLRHACGYALANKGHDTRAIDHQHSGLHGAGAESVQRLLAGVSASRWRCTENGSGHLSDGRCASRHQLHGVDDRLNLRLRQLGHAPDYGG